MDGGICDLKCYYLEVLSEVKNHHSFQIAREEDFVDETKTILLHSEVIVVAEDFSKSRHKFSAKVSLM